jgi:HD-GYP domain-containing protein (c-di-GMP phosphodiesterase class II)
VRGGHALQQHPTVTFGLKHALATGGEDASGTMRDQASLVALLRLTTALAARSEPEAIARAVAAAALPGCGCRRIALVLVPGGGAPWEHVTWTDGDEPGPPMLVDAGIVETVLRTRQCLQVPARSAPGALEDHVLCAPLQARHAVLGVVWAEAPGDAEPPTVRHLAFLEAVGVQAGLAIDRDRLFNGLEEAYIGTIRSLVTALEIRDQYTRGHAERVTACALALGERMGLPPEELEALEIAGLLHDVGKVGMGEDLLHRATPLTPDDRVALQHHADWGGEIVRNIRHPSTARIESAVRHHHEHWDGTGYPDGLAGQAIPLTARLLAVADTWDAMTSTRPYRDAMEHAHARKQLVTASGTQLDPAVVEEFLEWLDAGAPAPTRRGPRRSRYVPTSLTPLPAIPRLL